MRLQAKCKVCGKALFVDCPDDYSGDPHNLIPLLTCKECIDYVKAKMKLEAQIMHRCYLLWSADRLGNAEPTRAKIRPELLVACRGYSRCLSEHLKSPLVLPPDELAEALIKKPGEAKKLLRGFRAAAAREAESLKA